MKFNYLIANSHFFVILYRRFTVSNFVNKSILLIKIIMALFTGLTAIGILNNVHAEDNSTSFVANMTKGNATMTMGNTTGGNETSLDNATGTISSRGHSTLIGNDTPATGSEMPEDVVGHISRRSR